MALSVDLFIYSLKQLTITQVIPNKLHKMLTSIVLYVTNCPCATSHTNASLSKEVRNWHQRSKDFINKTDSYKSTNQKPIACFSSTSRQIPKKSLLLVRLRQEKEKKLTRAKHKMVENSHSLPSDRQSDQRHYDFNQHHHVYHSHATAAKQYINIIRYKKLVATAFMYK